MNSCHGFQCFSPLGEHKGVVVVTCGSPLPTTSNISRALNLKVSSLKVPCIKIKYTQLFVIICVFN